MAYLALILLGSLALCALMIVMVVYAPATIKLAIIGLVAFGGVFSAAVRGLRVKLQPPTGQPVTRAQAPKLFALLDELCAALDCRSFDNVLVVGDMNAAVVQIPRLGIFGWHKNYLLLGLPLMQCLAPDEFKAVLAHEFAHSSRGDGRFGNWLYRVRRSWAQVFDQMVRQRNRWGAVVFKFMSWFWPLFNGHAFVLARRNEYLADACAVRLAGADAAASALVRLRLDSALAGEKFWPDFFSRAKVEKEPPQNVMVSFHQALQRGPDATDAERWLREAFLIETNNADTHPCLKDRLRAIGRLPAEIEQGQFPTTAPPLPRESAAEVFLGDVAEVIAARISDEWHKAVAPQWAARYEQMRKLAGKLNELDKPADAPPNAADLWMKARMLLELHGDAAARPALEQLIAVEPGHAAANLILGRHYLQQDDLRGIQLIEAAMAFDPTLTQNGCNLLYGYYCRKGQRDKLRPLENRVDQFYQLSAVAQQERARVTVADTFIAPELTAEQSAAFQKVFDSEPEIFRMAVTRKQVKFLPGSPCFVVSLEIKAAWWKVRSSSANRKLVQRVLDRAPLPGHRLVFVREAQLKKLGTKVFATSGAVLYKREERHGL